jgi:hypothetical protein
MSLDIDLMVTQPVSVWDWNITHNLGKMAREVIVDSEKSLTLYDILWRPDESGFVYAREIVEYLDLGWNILLSDPEKYKTYNPENGWGSYDGLCNFVYNYRNACWDNPDAEIRVSR